MTDVSRPYRVLVVCLGNICRSPMAEVVLRERLDEAGLGERVQVDSAGTGDWHAGEPADERTLTALDEHGYDGTGHRARQFSSAWFADRDLILVADRGHLDELRDLAPDESAREKVRLLREFDPEAVRADAVEVDDPYFGDSGGFDRVLAEIEQACRGVVSHLQADLGKR